MHEAAEEAVLRWPLLALDDDHDQRRCDHGEEKRRPSTLLLPQLAQLPAERRTNTGPTRTGLGSGKTRGDLTRGHAQFAAPASAPSRSCSSCSVSMKNSVSNGVSVYSSDRSASP